MIVKAEFFADLRDNVGGASMDVSFGGGTVLDLIDAVDGILGGIFKDLIVQRTDLKDLVKILVNGRDVRGLRGLYTELKEGDNVSFFPPIAGG